MTSKRNTRPDDANIPAGRPARPPVGKRIIFRNGVPVPVYFEPHTKETVSELIMQSVGMAYKPHRFDIDPETGEQVSLDSEFEGMTYIEVITEQLMRNAAYGSQKAIEYVMDRIMGKPKQAVESVSMQMDYQQWLDFLSKEENAQNSASITVSTAPPNGVTLDADFYEDDEDSDDPLAGL